MINVYLSVGVCLWAVALLSGRTIFFFIYEHMPAEITFRVHTRDQDRTPVTYTFPMHVLIVSLTVCDYTRQTAQTPKTAYLKGTPVLNMPQNH